MARVYTDSGARRGGAALSAQPSPFHLRWKESPFREGSPPSHIFYSCFVMPVFLPVFPEPSATLQHGAL